MVQSAVNTNQCSVFSVQCSSKKNTILELRLAFNTITWQLSYQHQITNTEHQIYYLNNGNTFHFA